MDHDRARLDVYGGVRWNAVSKYGVHLIDFAVTIVLARLLVPEDYGLFGLAMVFAGFVKVMRNLGFGEAIIRWKTVSEELLSGLFYFNLAFTLLLSGLLVLTSPVFAWLCGDSRVGPVVAALSATFVFSTLALVPNAILSRQMAFDQLATRELTTAVFRGFSAIMFALWGWGVWALVWSTVIGAATRTAMVYALCRWYPRKLFHWSQVRSALHFGTLLSGVQVFNYIARNADSLIIGTFIGPTALGYYSLAHRLMLFPRDAITEVVGGPVFRTLARLQDDNARLRSAYLRLCGAIAFVSFPMMLGLAAVAAPFAEVVLGAKWLPVVPLFVVLAPLGAVQSLALTLDQIFLVKGRADLYLRWSVAGGILFIGSFCAGAPWGALGIATAYCLTSLAWAVPSFWFAFRLVDGLKSRDLAKVIWPHVVLSAGMMALVAAFLAGLDSWGAAPRVALPACVALGVVVYVLGGLWMRPPAVDDLFQLLSPFTARFHAPLAAAADEAPRGSRAPARPAPEPRAQASASPNSLL